MSYDDPEDDLYPETIKSLEQRIAKLEAGEGYVDQFMRATTAFLQMQHPDKLGELNTIDWYEGIKQALTQKQAIENAKQLLVAAGYTVADPIQWVTKDPMKSWEPPNNTGRER